MQDVNKLNKTIKDCDENIKNTQTEIDELLSKYNKSKNEAAEKYNRLKSEISKFLETINVMLVNLCAIHTQYISYCDGRLLFRGRIPEDIASDAESCFGVFKTSVKSIYDSTSFLLVKKTETEENCKNICRCMQPCAIFV